MDRKTLDDTSKFLSYALRHQPEAIGLTLDGEGWADIDALIAGAARDGRALDRALLGAVVENNDKKRFALSADGQRIRAVQGHSHAAVAIAYAPAVPPAVLYHGTASRFLDSIRPPRHRPGSRPPLRQPGSAGNRRARHASGRAPIPPGGERRLADRAGTRAIHPRGLRRHRLSSGSRRAHNAQRYPPIRRG